MSSGLNAIELHESMPLLVETDAELSWNLGWAYFKPEDWKAAQVHLSRACALKSAMAVSWWPWGITQIATIGRRAVRVR
jgi:uncharacterized protein HemY